MFSPQVLLKQLQNTGYWHGNHKGLHWSGFILQFTESLLRHEAVDFVEQAPEHGRDEGGVGDEAADDGQSALANVPHLQASMSLFQ